jgi:hypothetical protein
MAMMNPELWPVPVLAWFAALSMRCGSNRALRRCRVAKLRGREAVCAQSTILDKTQSQTVVAFIHNRVFRTDAPFIRTENTVGARSAQVRWWRVTVPKTSNLVADVGKHGATHG